MCTSFHRTCCNCADCLCDYRETWCAVERTKEQDWCRKQRAHLERYQEEMTSDIFGMCIPKADTGERCIFLPDIPPRREQRHFPKIHIYTEHNSSGTFDNNGVRSQSHSCRSRCKRLSGHIRIWPTLKQLGMKGQSRTKAMKDLGKQLKRTHVGCGITAIEVSVVRLNKYEVQVS